MNLVTNAIDAMPGGGVLDLCVSMNDKINNRQKIRYVEIKIEDTGRGIPQEDREKIFEPFYTSKKPGEGTGLGLSVSYGIIKDHDGDILVDSQPGRGTTFTVLIPVAERWKSQKKLETAREVTLKQG